MTTRISKAVLKLLDQPVLSETPAQHVRNAIQSLILIDERVAQLTIPPDPMLTDLIRSAEARMFRALFALGMESCR